MTGKAAWYRNPKRDTQHSFVTVVKCPNDCELEVPLYDPGRAFDRTSFAESLRDGCFPYGMVVSLAVKKRKYTFMVYSRRCGECYLHECDGEYLIEGGVEMVVVGGDGSGRLRTKEDVRELPLMKAMA